MQDRFNSSSYSIVEYRNTWCSSSTPGSFFKQARKHIREMQNSQEALQKVQTMFNGIEDTWQYHCDVALKALTTLQDPSRAFCDLLRQSPDFPVAISLHWYQLVIALCHIHGQGDDLTLLLTNYRSHCLFFSKHTLRQREEIYFKLKALAHSCNDCLQKVTRLLDEAQFLVKQNSIFYDLEEEEKLISENGCDTSLSAVRWGQEFGMIPV